MGYLTIFINNHGYNNPVSCISFFTSCFVCIRFASQLFSQLSEVENRLSVMFKFILKMINGLSVMVSIIVQYVN